MQSVAASYEAFKKSCEKNFPKISPRVLEKMIGTDYLETPAVIVYKRGTDLTKKMECLEKQKIKLSTGRSFGGVVPKDCPEGPTAKAFLALTEKGLKALSNDTDVLRVDFDPEYYQDENYPRSSY